MRRYSAADLIQVGAGVAILLAYLIGLAGRAVAGELSRIAERHVPFGRPRK